MARHFRLKLAGCLMLVFPMMLSLNPHGPGRLSSSIEHDPRPPGGRVQARALAQVSSPCSGIQGMAREDPLDVIHTIELAETGPGEAVTSTLPADARATFRPAVKESTALELPQAAVIHPQLRRQVDAAPAGARARVVIHFEDDLFDGDPVMPRFPAGNPNEAPDSAANQAAAQAARACAAEIEGLRAPAYVDIGSRLRDADANLIQSLWLIKAVLADVPLDRIEQLATQDDVLQIAPELVDVGPPGLLGQDAEPMNDVGAARLQIGSEPLFAKTAGLVKLLDTGLQFSHALFQSPSNIVMGGDCLNGGDDCMKTGDPFNANDHCGNHGTSVAAIISGNDNMGNAHRGLTDIRLNSYRIYEVSSQGSTCGVGLHPNAAAKALQAVLITPPGSVAVAEIQNAGSETEPGSPSGPISAAANAAFDAGAVVIAANGNVDTSLWVAEPAVAHKVIAVGGYDLRSGWTIPEMSFGPAPDGRVKPDILAPTNIETATTGCAPGETCTADSTALGVIGGTSGAAASAAGTAALVWNLLRPTHMPSVDPGQVYAFMILAGQSPFQASLASIGGFRRDGGAGKLRLPVQSASGKRLHWGKVRLQAEGERVDIPLGSVPEGSGMNLDAALWWPERVEDPHVDIDLVLVAPDGQAAAESSSANGVFERARVGNPKGGTWHLRIDSVSEPNAPGQVVYWAAAWSQAEDGVP